MLFEKRCLIFWAGIIMLFLTDAAFAQPESPKADLSLKGVDGLYVKVSNLDPDLKDILSKKNLTETILAAEMERKLDSAGIKAEPEELFRKTGKENCLFLKIEIMNIELKNEYIKIADSTKLPKTKFLYRLRLEFRQNVALTRNADIKTMATTWMKDDFGYRRLEAIHDAALSLTDVFVQEFIAVNR